MSVSPTAICQGNIRPSSAAGVFAPAVDVVLRPEIAAPTMSASSPVVAVNALALTLRRRRLPMSATEDVPARKGWARATPRQP